MIQTPFVVNTPKSHRTFLALLSEVLVVAVVVGVLVFSLTLGGGDTASAATSASAAPSASHGTTIARIAQGQLGGQCTNYYGCPFPGQWCAEFAGWVWSHAGVNTSGLTAAAGSFYVYGQQHHTLSHTPKVGDAVVFGYNGHGFAQHVALVVSVNTHTHTIVSVGGNERGGAGVVAKDGSYSWKLGFSSFMGMTISGYIAPAGEGKPSPACPPELASGSSGSLVASLQRELDTLHAKGTFSNSPYAFHPPLAKDGQFGPLTRNAVKDFQKKKGLQVDGIVGPHTWHALGRC